MTIDKGDIYGIVGYSGAGKSTLVRVINLLQRPTAGTVIINKENILTFSKKELRQQRKKIGMIFQHFNLMKERTIFSNIDFSLKYSGLSKSERRQKISHLLELVGLSEKRDAYPSQLSGGQKQRVAIARALANDPEILLCDEATSALDPKTTGQILALLKKLNQELNLTIVLITHEMQVVKEICNKVAVMENGCVVESNDIVSIFSQPQQPLTKDFIRTATHIDQALTTILEHPKLADLDKNQELIEFSYVGDQTNEPLIAQLYSQYQVYTNILYGNVEIVQNVPIGHLIVVLSGDEAQRQQALAYLAKQGVRTLYSVLEKIINVCRSIPFIIMLALIQPLTRILAGTTIGTTAALVPLVIGVIPFFARQIENALLEVDPGVIEAAEAMGTSPLGIIFRVYLIEGLPSIIRVSAVTIINLIGLTAMAGAIGAGGLGNLAITRGYNRFQTDVTFMATLIILIMVFISQAISNQLIKKTSH